MDKFLTKRLINSDDESVIEAKVSKVSEMSSDVKTSRECLNQKVNKRTVNTNTVTSSLDSLSMLKKVIQNVLFV